MKLTSAEEKGNYFNLYLDDKFFLKILKETFFKCNLKLNTEYESEYLFNLINTANNDICYEKALNYISKYSKTKKELKDYLLKKSFTEENADFAISKLEKYNFINDKLYAESFIKYNCSKGKKFFVYELKKKGINDNIIEEALFTLDEDTEKENAIIQAKKYLRNKEINEKSINGLYSNLSYKGFSYEIIKNALSYIKENGV